MIETERGRNFLRGEVRREIFLQKKLGLKKKK
jgi:hypothetical protein